MDPFSLSNTAWSLARLNEIRAFECSSLLDSIAQDSVRSIGAFQGVNLANMMWSFGKLKRKNVPLLKAVSRQTLKLAETIGPEDIVSIALGFTQLRERDEQAMGALASAAINLQTVFEQTRFAVLLSCFTRLKMENVALMKTAIQKTMLTTTNYGSSGDLWLERADILLAAAKMNVSEPALFDFYLQQLLQKPSSVADVSLYAIAAMLVAGKDLGVDSSHPQFYQAWENEAKRRSLSRDDIFCEEILDSIEWNARFCDRSSKTQGRK